MIIASQGRNALGCVPGSWKIWSLSDGHVDMPADLHKELDTDVMPLA